ncbi:hypothetical protein ACM66B_005626 [Microbotryomycetes sp. NB124-2]
MPPRKKRVRAIMPPPAAKRDKDPPQNELKYLSDELWAQEIRRNLIKSDTLVQKMKENPSLFTTPEQTVLRNSLFWERRVNIVGTCSSQYMPQPVFICTIIGEKKEHYVMCSMSKLRSAAYKEFEDFLIATYRLDTEKKIEAVIELSDDSEID